MFNASTGINPQSGQLANASATDIANNGLPRSSYSIAIDGARAGQPFNDEYYGGISSAHFGTLTFGRQRALGTDAMLLYDPAGGSYAFSYIGYNGTMAGGGDTEDTRWDDALKYRLTYGPVHFGAMYKFADGSGGCYSASATWTAATCTPEAAHNNAYGFDLGGGYRQVLRRRRLPTLQPGDQRIEPLAGASESVRSPYQSTTDSINTNPITGANLIGTTNTVYGIVTDNSAIMGAAKYTWDPFKFFAGYEYIRQNNPTNPLGVGALDQGGYLMSGVEDNNLDSHQDRADLVDGREIRLRQQNRHHFVLVSSAAERLPCSVDLLARSRFPQFLRGHPQRGVALCGSSLHQAFRRFCRNCVFLT